MKLLKSALKVRVNEGFDFSEAHFQSNLKQRFHHFAMGTNQFDLKITTISITLAGTVVPCKNSNLIHISMKRVLHFSPFIFSLLLMTVQFRHDLSAAVPANSAASVLKTGTGTPLILSLEGWTIIADGEKDMLTISHDSLGLLLSDVRLNVKNEQGLNQLTGWFARVKEGRELWIRTNRQATTLVITLFQNSLKISSTSDDMVLTAEAPSTLERPVARLIDPNGVPVSWVGTDEVVESFGGKETRNLSFLPVRNSDVMTFALGQVSGSNIHGLFDRKKDIAIRFSEQTILRRDPERAGKLIVTMPVPGNTMVRLIPEYYTHTLGVPLYSRFDDSVFPSAPVVWCSWTSYYHEARESDIIRNTDWLAANLKPYGFKYVQIDDGYDNDADGMKHNWIDHWDKRAYYPQGPQWIASYIKSRGLHPGIWLVPNVYAGAITSHPDWYLRDAGGNLILDYLTPSLDCTNPGVQDWLRRLFTTLKNWGFEYYKFDGEFALPRYAPAVDKTKLYDKSIDPLIAYRNRLKLIRDVIGPGTFVEGCPAGTPLNGIGYFNSSFCGHDVYNSWQGMYALFSSINANAFLNHMVIYLMPGEGIDIAPAMNADEARKKRVPRFLEVTGTREEPLAGYGTTLAQARTLVSFVSLTGVVYPLASIMPELPEERTRLLKMTMPTMPILPVDLFSRGTDMTWDKFKHTTPDEYIHNYPDILDLKVNAPSGIYDVAGMTNWRSFPATRELSFPDKLGLDAGTPFVVFDFWEQKLLGVYRDKMTLAIEPFDTRVLLVHPLLNRPQLIGSSRHITGAWSILSQSWDPATSRLSGSSETVPGDPYDLFLFVPDGTEFLQATATTAENPNVPIISSLAGNSLKLSFTGQPVTVNWNVEFTGKKR
jgi:hypothetical protein